MFADRVVVVVVRARTGQRGSGRRGAAASVRVWWACGEVVVPALLRVPTDRYPSSSIITPACLPTVFSTLDQCLCEYYIRVVSEHM